MLEGMVTKSNRRKDLNQSAFFILQQATGEIKKSVVNAKKMNAQESGRRGGIERAKKLSSESKIDSARLAASARWKKTA
jgi:hypothetical protein